MEWKQIWHSLPSSVENQFQEGARRIEVKKGNRIYLQGEAPQGLHFINSGLVGLVVVESSFEKEHLLRLFRAGQFFGHRSLFSGESYHGSAVALETTVLRTLPKNVVLKALDQHPFLYKEILRVLSQELKQCELRHVMILENEIRGRVARALIYLKDLHPEHSWTRTEIANFCASTPSTVIKTLALFEKENLIRQRGRAIEILDREGLISLQEMDA